MNCPKVFRSTTTLRQCTCLPGSFPNNGGYWKLPGLRFCVFFARDRLRHRCPTKPHALDELVTVQQPPDLLLPVSVPEEGISRWLAFTDGSGPLDEANPLAGWGVAIWAENNPTPRPNLELFGPVCTTRWKPGCLGADSTTNNAAEVTAMVETLIWLEEECPELPVTVLYNSQYAFSMITGKAVADAKFGTGASSQESVRLGYSRSSY